MISFFFCRCLEGLKPPVRKNRKSSGSGVAVEEVVAEPLPKKLRLEETDPNLKEDSLKHEAGTDTGISCEERLAKRSQIVVGLNEVTKTLERGNLRAGLVCLSAKPSLMHQHILVLAASRGVPCAALRGLSQTVAPALGLNSALAVGVKVILRERECKRSGVHVYVCRVDTQYISRCDAHISESCAM